MKRLKSVENDEVQLEIGECDCGYHFGVDATFLDQKGDFTFFCPSCKNRFNTNEFFPEDEPVRIEEVIMERVVDIFTLCGPHRDSLSWDDCSDTFEYPCDVQKARAFRAVVMLLYRWDKAYRTYSILSQPKHERGLQYPDKVPYEPPGALSNDTSDMLRALGIKP